MKPDSVGVYVDRSRQLRVLDPLGRQMLISCGCALFNARVAFAAAGLGVSVERFPDSASPDLLARLVADPQTEVDPRLAELDPAIDVRRTNRRRFDDRAVPAHLVQAIADAAAAEGSELVVVTRPEHRAALARLSQLADGIENANPAYRAELRTWTTEDPERDDGVPAYAVPRVLGNAEDDLPIRDFDTHAAGSLPTQTRSSLNQCLVLLGAGEDNPLAWLRAGEALERMLLVIARMGFTASPLTQVVELPRTNAALRDELGLLMHPYVLLRVGRAPATPATRRRYLVDMVH
ncbi:MAG: nitroreductase family protein [Actinomycetota bacterium]|nr:nitroreductase family protein [Actinomycetota bacterium]